MGEDARSRPEFSKLLCQTPQVLFTEVLTVAIRVMYRRFMTRLLSSCARPLPARVVLSSRYPGSASSLITDPAFSHRRLQR